MKLLTKAGILLLIVGLSLLAGTLYRSTSELGFSLGSELSPNSWSCQGNVLDPNVMYIRYFLAPRDYSIEVQTNAIINVYVMDTEGIRLWITEGELEPVRSYEEVGQETVTFHLTSRDDYVFLCYNPLENSVEYRLIISGYGIEEDLLYASLAIIVTSAVVTLASFIPRRNSNKKQKVSKKTGVLSGATLAFLMLSLSVSSCVAQPNILAPTWMKEGTYAYYPFPLGSSEKYGNMTIVNFVNGTNIMYTNVTSVNFRWDCVQLDGNMATLNVSYNVTTEPGIEGFYTSILLNVDTVTRNLYLQNGTPIGTTMLWLPSSPAKGQEIVLWDVPPEKVTATIVTEYENGEPMYFADTPQGTQRFFQYTNPVGIMNGVNVTNDSQYAWSPFYEYDTGLMVGGMMLNETMIAALDLNPFDPFMTSMFTNVDMMQPKVIIDWVYVLGLVAIVGSIVILFVGLVVKRLRKRK
jgi:hypothetical protein